jgi:surface protein
MKKSAQLTFVPLLFLICFIFPSTSKAQNFQLAGNGVTITCDAAAVGESGTIGGVTYTKIDSKNSLQVFGGGVPADQACTSGVTSMSGWLGVGFPDDNVIKFAYNPDISHWDVSDVTNMNFLFNDLRGFNQDLSYWDVSKVTRFVATFQDARAFNSDISSWDVSSGEIFYAMFLNAFAFSQDIGDWDLSGIDVSKPYGSRTGVDNMFNGSTVFNQDLSGWCVSALNSPDHYNKFDSGSAIQSDYLPQWGQCPPNNPAFQLADNGVTVTCKDVAAGAQGTVAQVTYTKIDEKSDLDLGSGTGVPADQACTSGIESLREWFQSNTTFNDDISHWDVSDVTTMFRTFSGARAFNQNISNWDVSKVTNDIA